VIPGFIWIEESAYNNSLVRADVVERQGLRRDLLGRELLVRPGRGVIVVPNRGVPQNVQTNNAWVSFINHDGSVHTARWIGVQNPGRSSANLTPPLVLNEPYGSDIANGMLYVADRDGGTTPTDPSVAVIRRFDMQTGAPAGEIRVDRVDRFNDIEVADDGTIYATQTGDRAARIRIRRPGRCGRSRRTARVDLRAGRAAPSAQRHRLRSAGQHRRRQHRQHRSADVLAGRPAAEDRERGAGGQRRPGDHAGRHEVREQRRQRRRLAHPARQPPS
jgi:hypothetical protein